MSENSSLPYADISLLYVEDEDRTRDRVSRVLSARGYSLTVAKNGEQGLDYFRKLNPDIVLTDIMMPRLNGLEMARAIRDLAPETQIACMTAYSDTSYLIEAIDIGVNQFILKPIEFSRLFTALDRCQDTVKLRRRQKVLEAENINSRKNEAIAVLAGGMAHDFNNLLQVILGYVSLARMKAKPGSKTEELLAVAEQSSEKARELASRLMTFAKGGAAFMTPTQPELLIREGIEAGLNSPAAIKTVINLPNYLPLVLLDVDQIQQVVTSLVINACEAMPQGGALNVSGSAIALTAPNDFCLPVGDYLHVIFEDTGVGIPPENLPMIFDPYFSTKEMGCQKGMGLGLALCQTIIKHHNGHIRVESTPGAGTQAHLYLPAYQSEE